MLEAVKELTVAQGMAFSAFIALVVIYACLIRHIIRKTTRSKSRPPLDFLI